MKKTACLFLTTVVTAVVLLAASAEASGGRHGHRHSSHHGHFHGKHHHHFGGHRHHFHGHRHFHGHHHLVGPRIFIGVGPVWPVYRAYPAPVVIQQAPPVYIQQEPAPEQQFWYFCENPRGYYPHVPQCAGGWLKVLPQ